MTISELDLSPTTGAQTIAALAGGFVPQSVTYVQFVNNSASASVTYSLTTPVTNGAGVTLAAGASSTISCPPGVVYPLASVSIMASAAAKLTVLLG